MTPGDAPLAPDASIDAMLGPLMEAESAILDDLSTASRERTARCAPP